MEKAFEREKNDKCIIVPILLKKTSLNNSMPFYNLKTLPTDRKAISNQRDCFCVLTKSFQSYCSVLLSSHWS